MRTMPWAGRISSGPTGYQEAPHPMIRRPRRSGPPGMTVDGEVISRRAGQIPIGRRLQMRALAGILILGILTGPSTPAQGPGVEERRAGMAEHSELGKILAAVESDPQVGRLAR